MIYISALFIFTIFSSVSKKREAEKWLFLFYILLLLFASFRFGMGTDYFNYHSIFLSVPDSFFGLTLKDLLIRRYEPGYLLINVLLKSFNLSFDFFVAFCAFVTLTLIFYTIQKFSKNKLFSLFLFFGNYYMVYIESTLRQGIAMSIFIYAFYNFLSNGNKIKYCFLILLGMTFHVSIIIGLFIVPIALKINKKYFLNPIFIFGTIILLLGFSLIFPKIILSLPFFRNQAIIYYASKAFLQNTIHPIFPISLRLVELFFVYFIFKKRYTVLTKYEIGSIKVFFVGVFLYLCVSSIGIFSRLTSYFMFLEIIFIPNILITFKKDKRFSYYVFIWILFIFLFLKNIIDFSYQRDYPSHNIIDFKYITIFNKDEIRQVWGSHPLVLHYSNK